MSEVLEEGIKPADCAIAFGIPTSREAFIVRRQRAAGDSFAGRLDWVRYERLVIRVYRDTLGQLERRKDFGLTVVHRATSQDLGRLFASTLRVVVLFSHWAGDEVELFDGFQGTDAVVARVPKDYSGLVDLCVCHPRGLPAAIKARAPGCRVRYTEGTHTASIWLAFYMQLFRLLWERERTYGQAFLEAMDHMLQAEAAVLEL